MGNYGEPLSKVRNQDLVNESQLIKLALQSLYVNLEKLPKVLE